MPAVFYASYVVLWILLLIQGVLLLLVYRHFGLMALGTVEGVQRDGLPVGEVAPTVSGVTPQGETITWIAKPDRSYLLAFVSSECAPCARILPSINRLAAANREIDVLLVVAGPQQEALRLVDKFQPPPSIVCLAEDGSGAYEHYRVRVTPFAFMVGRDTRIHAKGLCDNPLRLANLLAAGGIEISQDLTGSIARSI